MSWACIYVVTPCPFLITMIHRKVHSTHNPLVGLQPDSKYVGEEKRS